MNRKLNFAIVYQCNNTSNKSTTIMTHTMNEIELSHLKPY